MNRFAFSRNGNVSSSCNKRWNAKGKSSSELIRSASVKLNSRKKENGLRRNSEDNKRSSDGRRSSSARQKNNAAKKSCAVSRKRLNACEEKKKLNKQQKNNKDLNKFKGCSLKKLFKNQLSRAADNAS